MKIASLIQTFSHWSIRRKLIGTFLIITILPMGLFAYYSNRAARASLTQAANRALFYVASQAAEKIDNFIEHELEVIQIEAQSPLFVDFLSLSSAERENTELTANVQKFLDQLFALHTTEGGEDAHSLIGFSLLDRTGTILVDTHPFSGTNNPYLGLNWAERSWFTQPMLLGEAYSSPVEVPQTGDFPSIYFSARIVNEFNEPLGVLVAHYDAGILQGIIVENNDLAGEGSFGAVFDENLIFLAHGTRPELLFTTVADLDQAQLNDLQRVKRLPEVPVSQIISVSPELQAGLKNGLPFFSVPDIVTNTLINQVAVARLTHQPWQVAFFQPQTVFLEPARQQTTNILLFAGIITVLSVGTALLAAQGLGAPIVRLTTIAEQVTGGDLSVEAEVTSRDEIGVLAQTFNGMTVKLRQTLTELEQRVEERTQLLQATAEVGRVASASLNMDELIRRVVNLITERFGYDFAAIFLVDNLNEWAELKDASGEGNILFGNQTRLEVGGRSLISAAIITRQGQIAREGGKERFHLRNPMLPEIPSEIALPLIIGENVIGVLDVQSTQPNAFSEQDIETLQNMANQVAIAIQNARLYQQAHTQLTEISRLNQSLMREGWQSFLQANPNPILQFADNQLQTLSKIELPEKDLIFREKGPVFSHQENKAVLTLPIVLRDQVIGMLHLKSNKAEWHQDDLTIIQTVTRQAALAFENARLVEASQQLAAREHQINQITATIHNASNMDAILKTTLTELAKALNVQEARIQLSRAKWARKGQNGNHS